MNHDQMIDAYLHLINVSTDKRQAVDRLFWRAFEIGLDAGVDLERGDVTLMVKDGNEVL